MIIQNEAECRKCGDIIWSAHTHDFKSCKCGAIATDGGMAYIGRAGEPDDQIDRSMFLDDEIIRKMRKVIDSPNGRNSLGVLLAVIGEMRDNDLLNMEAFKG